MKFIFVIIFFFLLSQNVYCSTFTCELMSINKKLEYLILYFMLKNKLVEQVYKRKYMCRT